LREFKWRLSPESRYAEGGLVASRKAGRTETLRAQAGRDLPQRRKAAKTARQTSFFFAPWHLCVFALIFSSGALPEVLADGHQLNYAVKSSLLLNFLESLPAASAKLKLPNTKDEKFEDVVKSAQDAAVLVLVC